MIAELIVASVFAAAGGPGAASSAPSPENAVIRHADAGNATIRHPMLQKAADLGCPRHYDRRRGHDRRCYERRGDPYHKNPEHRYGRYGHDSHDEDRYDERRRHDRDDERHERHDGRHRDRDYGRYDGRDGKSYRERYRTGPRRPRDTLRDRDGRPYRGPDDDRPPYRSGAYDTPRPDDRDHNRRGFSRDDRQLDPYRDSDGPVYRPGRGSLQLINHRGRPNDNGPVYKKKDMTVTGVTSGTGATIIAAMTNTTDTSDAKTGPRPAAFDAGSTV